MEPATRSSFRRRSRASTGSRVRRARLQTPQQFPETQRPADRETSARSSRQERVRCERACSRFRYPSLLPIFWSAVMLSCRSSLAVIMDYSAENATVTELAWSALVSGLELVHNGAVKKGRSPMPHYVSLLRYTAQGIAKVKESPSRLDAARKVA